MKKTLMAAALAMALAACSSVAPVAPQAAAPLKKADMDRLVVARPDAARGSFPEFLAQAAGETPSLRPAVAAYAAKAPLALKYGKEAVIKSTDLSIEDGIRLEAYLGGLLRTTEDRREGIAAILEKRKPVFHGK